MKKTPVDVIKQRRDGLLQNNTAEYMTGVTFQDSSQHWHFMPFYNETE